MQCVLDILVQLRVTGHLYAQPLMRWLVRLQHCWGTPDTLSSCPRPCLPLEKGPAVPYRAPHQETDYPS